MKAKIRKVINWILKEQPVLKPWELKAYRILIPLILAWLGYKH